MKDDRSPDTPVAPGRPAAKPVAALELLLERVGPRHPWLRRWLLEPAVWFSRRVADDQVGVEAGSTTYGAFLSIPPLLVLAISIASIVFADDPDAQQRVIDASAELLPGLDEVMRSQLELSTASQLGIGLIGALVLAWSASGFAARVRHALGIVFATEQTGLIVGRIGALLMALPLLIALVASVALGVVTSILRSLGLVSALVDVFSLAFAAVAACLVWTLVYRVLTPGHGPRLAQHLPGAIAFTAAFLVLERFGVVYVESVIARAEALYGAIGAIFGMLAFLYIGMWLFLLAAEVSRYAIERPWRRPDSTVPPEVPQTTR